ncbi:MAG: hypothetical protein K0S71_2344 [Clostridia bacterium]|jgi:hypothetical protein|nr:hypothetical protein [Clostridia bacterium]
MQKKVDKPFSQHIFMFAFKWNYMDGTANHKYKKYRKFREKVDLQKFDKKIKAFTKTKDGSQEEVNRDKIRWEQEKYKENRILDYNEYTYYYHNVRDAIYGDNKYTHADDKKVNIYHYKITKNAKYIIKTLLKNTSALDSAADEYIEKEYVLDITKIELKVYDTGVGILSFFAENYIEPSIEAVNRINDYGRRIYPQFIEKKNDAQQTQKTKETFLANEHILKLGEDKVDQYVENYSSDYEAEGNRISNIIMGLLGKSFKTGKSAYRNHLESIITVSPLIDDRMFVICFYTNKELADQLKQIEKSEGKEYYSYIKNDKWYEYIFAEKKKNCQSIWMMKKILKRHTYERWIDYGTLYGMSYCSFVCLTDGDSFGTQNISIHMTTIYYQMMCLVLAQKASILRFEDELTDISNHSKDIPIEAVEEVYQNYLQFINGIYFREVTAEDQGIELYTMAQNLMRIDIDVKELKEEIGQLFQYVSLRADKETNKAINSLTYLNTLILVPSLVTGFFGMNIFGERMKEAWNINDYKGLVIWTCIWIITVGILPIALIRSKGIQKLIKMIPRSIRTIIPWGIAGVAILAAIWMYFN